MLDTDTKRRIDTARDILVGKVPDPKSQVEQITIALIYKFMDDMDAEAEELGGKRKFFSGEFARYGWAKLMRSGLGGHETLNLYAEAIAKMPENPGIPPLFRDIFKNAFLPYRDPETLRAFLKIIDEFEYDHSERLGDAFEYLLSVLGSQGDAGQFRTPRHIIDFIVAIIDPKKTDTVLDPACGTAGFLISSYKHILKNNSSKPSPRPSPSGRGRSEAEGEGVAVGDLLTPDERARLAANFKGYDISPDMVRLSLVNLYLHGFTDPHIFEYDCLTSQDRWNEYADVILANPPFMSPKGGIKPHNRFSVQSKRSEVLFVDYMAEHLTPNGRAGIIVPEGIIFQSQIAYTQLRKMLVEDYLVAVVSLPAGVFNPYSVVKTSILILDKTLAKQAQTIAFFKIENDGFGLGAQRREIDKNDLPQARAEIAEYLRRLRIRESVEGFQPVFGLVIAKDKIAANGDYNLSGERYRENGQRAARFLYTKLVDVATIDWGNTSLTKDAYSPNGKYLGVSAAGCDGKMDHAEHRVGTLVLSAIGANCGRMFFPREDFTAIKNTMTLSPRPDRVEPLYLFHLLSLVDLPKRGGGQPFIAKSDVVSFQIPMPPLEVQKEIVAEIEGYQKVIDGARAVLDNYRPHIPIHPDWPMVELGEVAEIKLGKMLDREKHTTGHLLPYLNNVSLRWNEVDTSNLPQMYFEDDELDRFGLHAGDVVVCEGGEPGRSAVWDGRLPNLKFQKAIHRVRFNVPFEPRLLVLYLLAIAGTPEFESHFSGSTIKHLTRETFARLRVPLPPLATQQQIVAEIEAEQALVAANRELIARFEKKIRATLARVWGEDEPAAVES